MLNTATLMGRLTRDPELRQTQSGTNVASFSLAVERDLKNQNGQKETDFLDIVAWNKTAEFVSQYFRKGQLVAVSGRIQARTWTDNNGNNRKAVEIVAERAYFAEGKRDDAPQTAGSYPAPQPQTAVPSNNGVSYGSFGYAPQPAYSDYGGGFGEISDDDELPF